MRRRVLGRILSRALSRVPLSRLPSRGFCRGANQFFALPQQEMVRHSGDVVADHAMARLGFRLLRVIGRHAVGMLHEKLKERIERRHRAVAIFGDCRT